MTDRTTKILLALIAAALWVNLAVPLFRPATVNAQWPPTPKVDSVEVSAESIAKSLSNIEIYVGRIARR